jgi:hypothetical protein
MPLVRYDFEGCTGWRIASLRARMASKRVNVIGLQAPD